jgi:hypothetical protein
MIFIKKEFFMATNLNFNPNNQISGIKQDFTQWERTQKSCSDHLGNQVSKTISCLYKKALSCLESAKRWAHEHPTNFKTVAIISAVVGIGLLIALFPFKAIFIASVVLIVAASAVTVAKGVSDFMKYPL